MLMSRVEIFVFDGICPAMKEQEIKMDVMNVACLKFRIFCLIACNLFE